MGGKYLVGVILGLYRDHGKENGNYCGTLGLYRDKGLRMKQDAKVNPRWKLLFGLMYFALTSRSGSRDGPVYWRSQSRD